MGPEGKVYSGIGRPRISQSRYFYIGMKMIYSIKYLIDKRNEREDLEEYEKIHSTV